MKSKKKSALLIDLAISEQSCKNYRNGSSDYFLSERTGKSRCWPLDVLHKEWIRKGSVKWRRRNSCMHLVLWHDLQWDKESWGAAVKQGPNDATHAPSHQESDLFLLTRSIIAKCDFLSSRHKQHVRLKVSLCRHKFTHTHTHLLTVTDIALSYYAFINQKVVTGINLKRWWV